MKTHCKADQGRPGRRSKIPPDAPPRDPEPSSSIGRRETARRGDVGYFVYFSPPRGARHGTDWGVLTKVYNVSYVPLSPVRTTAAPPW